MTKFEIAKLKVVAMGLDMGKRVLILKALDTIENHEQCSKALEAQIAQLSEENCIEADCDCEKCGHTECACHDCRDCDKWEWRGAGV